MYASIAASANAFLAASAETCPWIAPRRALSAIEDIGPARFGHLSFERHFIASQTVWTRRVLPALPKLMRTGRSKRICFMA
jgi:hypothetical protein